jgi:protein TonB
VAEADKKREARWPLIVTGAIGAVLLCALGWFIYKTIGTKDDKSKRQVAQVVQVIRPPPPPEEPPPPPPPETKVEEPIPQDEPEPTPADEPAPSEQIGLDADGAAGADGFGLAARKGGRDITGNGGAVFAWYTGMLKERVLDRLGDDSRVRSKRFSIVVQVWIAPDGAVREARLSGSSGNRELDAAIQSALGQLGRLREGPPVEMPQPVSLRIVSKS